MKFSALPIVLGLGAVAGVVALAAGSANAAEPSPTPTPTPRPNGKRPRPRPEPVPAPPPDALTSVQLAHQLSAHLLELEAANGGVKGAKGKENKATVKRYQQSTNGEIDPDGNAGPATVVSMAAHGVGVLPLVFYWPHGADAKSVLLYRGALEALAGKARDPAFAAQLRASAARENGQGGIVGPGPDAQSPSNIPKPQPAPTAPTVPKSVPSPAGSKTVAQLAPELALHLHTVQLTFKTMKDAKGKEDQKLVARYQTAANLPVSDGKAGPATMVSLATRGVGTLPLVFYWPNGANAKTVTAYQATLYELAAKAIDPALAEALRYSAQRERGQAGIVGPPPATFTIAAGPSVIKR